MKRDLAIALVALTVFSAFVVPLSDDSEAAGPYYVEGTVVTLVNAPEPLSHVSVTVYINDSIAGTESTDDNGYFKVPIGGATTGSARVDLTIEGYSMANGTNPVELGNLTPVNGIYRLINDDYIMFPARYDVSGTVLFDGEPVSRAEISIETSDGRVIADTTTESNGTFSVTCPNGHYRLVIDRSGFDESVVWFEVNDADRNLGEISLTRVAEFEMFGLDTAHLLMIGVVSASIAVAGCITLFVHKRSDCAIVFDDEEVEDE